MIAIAVWRGAGATGVVRWLGLGLLWSAVFLTMAAPSLASVVPGLPNDHYHAFADPMVVVLVGLGLAAPRRRSPARWPPPWPSSRSSRCSAGT